MNNSVIATKLRDYARELEQRRSSLYRVRAYRRAADAIAAMDRELAGVFATEGRAGLEALPGVGAHLAWTLEQLLRSGEMRTLHDAEEGVAAEERLTSLPGIGPFLAQRLRDELGVTSIELLEKAARQGRLAALGMGQKRVQGLLDALAGRLGQSSFPELVHNEPDVEDLLFVDASFRKHVAEHPAEQVALGWLPLFRLEYRGWRYRASFCRTAIAQRLGKMQDWVTVSFDNGCASGQRMVVSEVRGDLRGRRVVRGRERACRAHYEVLPDAALAG
jgi:hypothetical protein